ncbi:MAG: Grx4 family monothiol glutaredoxin [Gammaproteobacteria bacterium]|nr:Grx4 family monothiol glutaredoxin [Gammaproteobacteria bacterium]NIV73305.1 Grx4 family monothiol glutaredoxin [Gammaproteobacteria bacterium]
MNVQETIKEAIENNEVILFMKGTPQFPQCGFSGRTVQVLQACGSKFAAVDVLADPQIREGIKQYSNWPTIPQLYVKGEFVGGCDIVMEMYQNGELQKLLAEAS